MIAGTIDFVELVEVPDPEPMPDGVVVDIELCGICGIDIHAWQSGDPYPLAIGGHEWTGAVSAVGSEVTSFSEGDRVVCAVPPACGRCEACIAGQAAWCQSTMLVAIGRDRHVPPMAGSRRGSPPTPAQAAGRTEPGCLVYCFAPDPCVETRIQVHELWTDEASLAAHFEHPNYLNMGTMLGDCGIVGAGTNKYRVDASEPVYDETFTPRADFFTLADEDGENE